MSNKLEATYGPGRTTPPLEARVAAVLAEHVPKRPWSDSGVMKCSCGERFVAEYDYQQRALHQTHVAAMLAPVIAEAQAEALESFASHYLHPEQDKHYLRESQAARVGYRQAVQAHANRYRSAP